LLWLTFVSLGISFSAQAVSTRYPVPNGAIDPKHVTLSGGASEQDYFAIKLAYPSIAVLDHYKRVFKGWTECKPRNTWESFGDISVPEPRFIHQLMWMWIDSENRKLIVLGIQYWSKGPDYRPEPDNDVQHAYLLEVKPDDARTQAEQMGTKCGT
jgi:hypothetical protein